MAANLSAYAALSLPCRAPRGSTIVTERLSWLFERFWLTFPKMAGIRLDDWCYDDMTGKYSMIDHAQANLQLFKMRGRSAP